VDVITLDRHDFSRYRTCNRKAFTNHFRLASSRSPDDQLADNLRGTVVATGLGMAAGQKTGTDNAPGPVDYHQLDQVPAVIRRNRASTVEALQQSGVDKYDIPAFLRKQAD
jgi:hypothetical protein